MLHFLLKNVPKCSRYFVTALLSALQLMGSFVLAVGLWLRFDPETVSLLNGDKAPDTFFIGECYTHMSWKLHFQKKA